MRRYELRCPKCDSVSVLLPAEAPEKPYCSACEEELDLEEVRKMVQAWTEYLHDVDEMLEKEGK